MAFDFGDAANPVHSSINRLKPGGEKLRNDPDVLEDVGLGGKAQYVSIVDSLAVDWASVGVTQRAA